MKFFEQPQRVVVNESWIRCRKVCRTHTFFVRRWKKKFRCKYYFFENLQPLKFADMTQIHDEQPLDAGFGDHRPESQQLHLTPRIRQYWMEIANWCTFLGSVLLFAILVALLGFRSAMETYFGVSVWMGVGIVFFCLLLSVPALLYWMAGQQLRKGMERSETEVVEAGFGRLVGAYRFLGFIALFYMLLLVVVLLLGGFAILMAIISQR